jgi:hypothetical protein
VRSQVIACSVGEAGRHREAARLYGAAHAIRQRRGAVRFKVYDAGYEASVAALRDAMGEKDFDSAWAEGAALSTEEAIALRPARPRQTQTTRQRLGVAHPVRARRGTTGQLRAWQQRHRHAPVRLTMHCANPPHTRLHQTRTDLPRAARPRSSPPRLIPLRQHLGAKRVCLKTGENSPDNLPHG